MDNAFPKNKVLKVYPLGFSEHIRTVNIKMGKKKKKQKKTTYGNNMETNATILIISPAEGK